MGRGTAEQALFDSPETYWQSKEILFEKLLGSSLVMREKFVRPDHSQVLITSIFASETSTPNLLIDPRFLEKRIVTEPGGLLIDQAATTKAWGSLAGLRPEKFLVGESVPESSVGIPPTNAGWQYGAFWIRDGRIISLPGDDTLTGQYEVITRKNGVWGASSLHLNNGNPTQGLDDLEIGFSMPLVVKSGQIVPQMSIWERGDPRALADPRNWVDLAAGQKTPPDFWRLVRKFMPINPASARRVTREGRFAVIRVGDIDPQDTEDFKKAVKDADLENHWRVVRDENSGIVRAVVCAILPPNRIPAVGVGHNKDGKLIVTVADGRQKESSGATIDELALIMKEKGTVNAGFGAAGGDAIVVAKHQDDIEIVNSPSNIDSYTGKRVTRTVPSLLVIS
ncbi:hypothetical protein A2962_00965 [Candidatus Woesebacteria bacterium RIFCSPLOWO2_01_FULL_39_61]|uniref:Phosphodiester glycosidase domain-containing protein n=1 Tax=Candidatus Woesebacteria bacterium RIFCSPHIGHO2_02_FULL_39_13 TaxID=1802505 RepID=A0A1F7Z344_9BACT|nr:MAG: hypothetical protein A2692_00420 [Candidatus Woesebacteria bacterium RIFCSPHIGHO2_01_FULL_39_95]OGM33348.1 MAG: hypothetical protein A3D01_00470 [Candidatus Woesebacteria bacterium RIFCSPHIGHO2_02_FULL_39_13]OGM68476.1 MAG: hypothetical protein A2962_00965 [Candidatus Woesebacteria bacterium RIFCSPLOWO2_01_FULL_39_61]